MQLCNEVDAKGRPRIIVSNHPTKVANTRVTKIQSQKKSVKPQQSAVTYRVSAYCLCEQCCGKTDGITASGTKAMPGRTIAVDPKVIPLGSKVLIGGKTYIAEDTGSNIKGYRIDVLLGSHNEAIKHGVQNKPVVILGR